MTKSNVTKNAKTILFASLIAVMILPFSGINSAFAATEAEQENVLNLVDRHEMLLDRLADLNEKRANAESEKQIEKLGVKISIVENKIRNVVEQLNGYNLFTADQIEELESAINLNDEEIRQEVAAACACDPELAFRSNFKYKWGAYTGYTNGNWKYDTTLQNDQESIASISWLNPDWIEPFVQAYMSPSGGGQIGFHVELRETVESELYKTYPDRIKGITGSGPYNANIWWEEKYYRATSYDKVITVGFIEIFP